MNVSPYLNFKGQCEEAFTFYAKALGGEIIALMRWAQMPGNGGPPGMENKIMHGHLRVGPYDILGCDPPIDRYGKPSGFGITIGADSSEEAERIYAVFREGGSVTMPMAETFFAHRFGMVTDRYGVPWMILHDKSQG